MKQFTTISKGMGTMLCLSIIFSLSLNAQISSEACHTVLQDHIYEQMRREAAIIMDVRNFGRRSSEAASADTVPVFFTVFRADDGSFADPLLDEALADRALAELNTYFSPIHLYFVRLGHINYIDNTAFTAFSKHHHLEAFSYVSSALNVYTKSGSGNFAQFPAAIGPHTGELPSGLVADRSNMLSLNSGLFLSTSFVHEIGHSYGLLHTFEGAQVYNNPLAPTPGYSGTFLDHPYGESGNIRRRELVLRQEEHNKPFSRPNGASAGDFVEDTPAFCVSTTAYPSFYPSGSQEGCDRYPFDVNQCNGCIVLDCNYEGDYVDYNGDTLINTQVSIRNLMSYTSCRSEFTAGQYERMAFYHEYVRKPQYDAGRGINFLGNVFFEDTAIPMDDIILQFSHPGQQRYCHVTSDNQGQFQAVLYDGLTNAHLMKAGSAVNPSYQSSPWVQASVAEILEHSYQAVDWLAGVDAHDLELLEQHLAGTRLLNGYHQLAADLDHDSQLTANDAGLLRALLAGTLRQPGAYDSPWLFLPAYIPARFPADFAADPFNMDIDGVAYRRFAPYLESDWTYEPGKLPEEQRAFRAIKLGDLDGSTYTMPTPVILEEPTGSSDPLPEPEFVVPQPQVRKFGCFPNPTAGALTVVFNATVAGDAELLVADRFFQTTSKKEVVLVEGTNELLIPGDELPAGVQVVILKTGEGVFYKKVIKIRN